MTELAVMYEQAGDGSWSASAVGLPVFAVGDTREDAEREIRSAIRFHLDETEREALAAAQSPQQLGTVEV
jgi:predicted RNase H-like HicB family nuclease